MVFFAYSKEITTFDNRKNKISISIIRYSLMKHNILKLFSGVFVTTVLLIACEHAKEYTARDWAGKWEIKKFVSKENPEKQNATNGLIVAENDEDAHITGDLFNLYSQLQIKVTIRKKNMTLAYKDAALSITGSGTLLSLDEILFSMSVKDMEETTETYNVKAFREK